MASQREESPADLYRLEATLDKHGLPVSVRGVRNLTESPAGDEFQLAVSEPYAVVATRSLGQVRSLTVLDMRGSKIVDNENRTPVTRVLGKITALLETGRIQGFDKTTIRFERPPCDVELVSKGGDAPSIAARWQERTSGAPQERIVAPPPRDDVAGLIAYKEVRLPKRPVLWLVDTVRSLSWVGPGPIEWAEGRFFAIKDLYKRWIYELTGQEAATGWENGKNIAAPVRRILDVPPGREIGADEIDRVWPPEDIEPPIFEKHGSEGKWLPGSPDFIEIPEGTPDLFYKTYLRPDKDRPYAKVLLYAMDMARLELHMVGGHEDPQSTTGSCGTGRIPRRPDLLDRVVVAFNGAFKTEHGAYGMMVEKNVLLPPKDDAATVATFEDGTVAMGSWPKEAPIPDDMVSYRQNMDPLVEGEVVNPRRRYLWGFTLDEDITKMNTIRSGACMTTNGDLIYAWGEDLTATTLGAAMVAAGCRYGIHLDMNPFHTAFIFYDFKNDSDSNRPQFDYELGIPTRYSPYRYINGAPKDFFFVARRGLGPGPGWSFEDLAQPAPAIAPALYRLTAGNCNLVAMERSRIETHLEPGTSVPHELLPHSALEKLPEPDPRRMLAQIILGPWAASRGQMVRGTIVGPMKGNRPTLAVNREKQLALGQWPLKESSSAPGIDAIQSLLLLEDRAPADDALALGWKGDKWFIVGEGPLPELEKVMAELEVRQPVTFFAPATTPGVLVRTQNGIEDLKGTPRTAVDPQSAVLHVSAVPVHLGMRRLEEFLAEKEHLEKGKR